MQPLLNMPGVLFIPIADINAGIQRAYRAHINQGYMQFTGASRILWNIVM